MTGPFGKPYGEALPKPDDGASDSEGTEDTEACSASSVDRAELGEMPCGGEPRQLVYDSGDTASDEPSDVAEALAATVQLVEAPWVPGLSMKRRRGFVGASPKSPSAPDMGALQRCGMMMERHAAGLVRRGRSLEDLLAEEEEASSHRPLSQWPVEVLEALRGGGCGGGAALQSQLAGALSKRQHQGAPDGKQLFLYCGAYGVPHPAKAASGGADARFADAAAGALGIADGVGEWDWRFGINARAFADELMAGCLGAATELARAKRRPSAEAMARELLWTGYAAAASFGSSTALVAVLGDDGELGVANLGDSGLAHLRPASLAAEADECTPLEALADKGRDAAGRPMYCVTKTKEQQHGFNRPYQLSRHPKPTDFPELLNQGKDKLVRAVQRSANKVHLDWPGDATCSTLKVQEGDLIVLGTDGLFDNLFLHEIAEIAGVAVSPSSPVGPAVPSAPWSIAEALTRAALDRSQDRAARTPFGEHAREAGTYHTGGKMDDITCVCAWVMDVQAAAALVVQ